MSQSIIGPLVNWTDREWRDALKWIFNSDGKPYPDVYELRRAFCNELLEGRRSVPLGKCDNFDYAGGKCLGHASREGDPS